MGNAATVAQVLAEIPPERLTLVTERLLERLDPPLPAGEASALAMHLFHACTGGRRIKQEMPAEFASIPRLHRGPAWRRRSVTPP